MDTKEQIDKQAWKLMEKQTMRQIEIYNIKTNKGKKRI